MIATVMGWVTSKLGVHMIPWAIVVILVGVSFWQSSTIEEYEARDAAHALLVDEQAKTAVKLQELEDERNQARAQVDDLRELLRTHDLAKLAKAKPGLIERRANGATDRLLKTFECITASAGCPATGTD